MKRAQEMAPAPNGGDGFGLRRSANRRKKAANGDQWPELSPQLWRCSTRAPQRSG